MRILIIGFIAFSAWSALSTYIYVCKIKGFCPESSNVQTEAISPEKVITDDTKSQKQEEALIPEDLKIYFAFDKYSISPNELLESYFNSSKAYLEKNSLAKVSITGHTDAVGSDAYNKALGFRRAKSLQNYFESKGMLSNKIIVDSKGEKLPTDANSTDKGRANNRRTEITIKK